MKWRQLPLGPLQTNCYIFSNNEKECLVIDPGGDAKKLTNILQQQHLKPIAILLTHAHFDHIGAVDDIRTEWNIPVYVHKNEKDWLPNPSLNGSQFFMAGAVKVSEADELIKSEGILTIGNFSLMVYETPGHSPGSVSFYSEEAGLVFSGDALFAGSIGRTDLPGGNHELLIKSIHEKLLVLPEDTLVLSGHGPETSIEAEMERNPFLNGF
ncbi:MBL fold metallo-hydrolase [Metabacillus sediminilitoris]|jgi:glyoxylase-like metal-dependent hydrolase (beta-lactamase superfamily II)|uniref:MBL fold metallo-hydrolase n=1 Tax=Metabacillus sediminilitoris TaxID=2567941 RepID=A0A4S4BZB5_9BACI|nr:MBL fold metallo-hydrolase [Metabacillus sediminilitoris]QGQ47258.1 MBL fold metallo-hydrolase [Metabacillus sediminilitoris]THF80600.1 MBL fold metallo-hydrolase [Metabacillus sediminilitoris]